MVTPKPYSDPLNLPQEVIDGLHFTFSLNQQCFAFYRMQDHALTHLDKVFEFDVGGIPYCLVRVEACAVLASNSVSPYLSSGLDPEPNHQLIDTVCAPQSLSPYCPLAELLTARELQIASLVAMGKSNKQVSANLRISEWTVSSHMRRIFLKLGVGTRAEMVFKCAPAFHPQHRS
jgi:DNA-binding CsgD family transcriptional regulator